MVKESLALVGEPVGNCRAPVGPFAPEDREVLKQLLSNLGLLAAAEAL